MRRFFDSWSRRTQAQKPYRLAVMGIVKNESMIIDEWIDHYLWQGADRVFLIDNGSTDDTVDRIRAWADAHPVTLEIRPEPHKQVKHYRASYVAQRIRRGYEWLLVADSDEYWYCPDGRSVANALSGYEGMHLIHANWTNFAPFEGEGHPESLRRALVMRRPGLGSYINRKWVCRTAYLTPRGIGLHRVDGVPSRYVISDNETFRINHYQEPSALYYRTVKMTRGDASSKNSDRVRTEAHFQKILTLPKEPDTRLADMVAARDASAG